MSGKPDLTLHTLSHFLDRFIYRTPKANQGARGSSIMQPLAGGDTSDRLVVAGQATSHVPLNSEAFWKKKAEDVSAEDVFFHEYFKRVGKDKDKARAKKEAKDPVAQVEEDVEGLSGDESEVWQALVDSRPELEDAGSDDDLDMDDLESAYDASEKEDEGEGEGSDDEGVIFNDESDPEEEDIEEPESLEEPPTKTKTKTPKKAKDQEPSDEDDDDFDMDVSDEEAFIGSDEELELPSDMEAAGEEEEEEKEEEKPKDSGKKKRKLKHLPTFASADDYAALLDQEDDGM